MNWKLFAPWNKKGISKREGMKGMFFMIWKDICNLPLEHVCHIKFCLLLFFKRFVTFFELSFFWHFCFGQITFDFENETIWVEIFVVSADISQIFVNWNLRKRDSSLYVGNFIQSIFELEIRDILSLVLLNGFVCWGVMGNS